MANHALKFRNMLCFWQKLDFHGFVFLVLFFFSPSFGTCMTIGLYIISEILMERRIRMTMRYDRMTTLGFTFYMYYHVLPIEVDFIDVYLSSTEVYSFFSLFLKFKFPLNKLTVYWWVSFVSLFELFLRLEFVYLFL